MPQLNVDLISQVLALLTLGGMLAGTLAALRLRQLKAQRYRLPNSSHCKGAQVPAGLRAQLRYASRELSALGFSFSHFQQVDELSVAVDAPRSIAVMVHRSARVYAEIGNSDNPDRASAYRVDLYTFYEDGRALLSSAELHHAVDRGSPALEVQPSLAFEPARAFAAHLAWMEEREAAGLGPRAELDPGAYVELRNRVWAAHLRALVDEGWLQEQSGEGYRVARVVEAARRAAQRLRRRRTKRGKTISGLPEAIRGGPEVDAYTRRRARQLSVRERRWYKLVFISLVALALGLLFGLPLSWTLVPTLLGVLMLHDLGHLAAMRAFGMQDNQVLLAPLGATRLDQDGPVPVWQRALVDLAGPLPGLVLALVIVTVAPVVEGWLVELLVLLLVINYLNLLPFAPLDGGQVSNLLLFDRFPKAQSVFLGIALAACVAGAFWLADPILLILAGLLGLQLPQQIVDSRLVASLSDRELWRHNRAERLKRIFLALADKPLSFAEKFNRVQRIEHRLDHRPVRTLEAVLILSLYLAALASPWVVAAVALPGLGWQTYPDAVQGDFDAAIAKAKDDAQRADLLLRAARSASRDARADRAQAYLIRAVELVESGAVTGSRAANVASAFARHAAVDGTARQRMRAAELVVAQVQQPASRVELLEPLAEGLELPQSRQLLQRASDAAAAAGDFAALARLQSQLLAQARAARELDLATRAAHRLRGVLRDLGGADLVAAVLALVDHQVAQDRWEDALALLDQAVQRLDPAEQVALYAARGWVNYFLARTQSARADFRRAEVLSAADRLAAEMTLVWRWGDPEDAQRRYADLVSLLGESGLAEYLSVQQDRGTQGLELAPRAAWDIAQAIQALAD